MLRGATLVRDLSRTLRDTVIPLTTDVCQHVAEYSAHAFDCTLRGPFAKQFLTRFSASRALCIVLDGFISASTVYYVNSITPPSDFVNSFFYFSQNCHMRKLFFPPVDQRANLIGEFCIILIGSAIRALR